MQKLIELAQKIEDRDLRKKVIEFIKNPTLSHKEFKKYPKTKIEDSKSLFMVGGNVVERETLNHIVAVTECCISIANIVNKTYGIPVNMDHLIAGALLHDIMKVFEYKSSKKTVEHTGVMLDHSAMAVAELYHREFPEQVIHMIASHLQGETGPTPPRNFEALILHHVDTMLAMIEFQWNAMKKQSQIPLILLSEEEIKKLGGKTEESK